MGNRASNVPGQTVGYVNSIRNELTNAGQGNYGQRTSYFLKVNNLKIVTFSIQARTQIMSTGTLNGLRNYTFEFESNINRFYGQREYGQ
jgi:hypothetical protein